MTLRRVERGAMAAALAAVCAIAMAGSASSGAAPSSASQVADAIVLLYASQYGPNHPFSRADRTWMDWVETRSRGAVRIRPVWSGALLSSDESLTELRHGVADIGLITPIYAKGGVHLIRVQTGFYVGGNTFQEQVAMYRCLAPRFPEFGRELDGLHILAVQGGALPGILTRTRRVTRLEDLKGLRIRAPTELLDVLDSLGAAPVDMAMDEVYSALAKGVIDGVVAPPDTLKALRFAEVAKYFFRIAVPRGAYPSRAMGEKRWQALPVADRKILEESTSVWESALARDTQAAVAAGETFGLSSGVEFHSASEADQRRFDAIYDRSVSHSAQELKRFGIDGVSVYRDARRIAAGIQKTGRVQCEDGA